MIEITFFWMTLLSYLTIILLVFVLRTLNIIRDSYILKIYKQKNIILQVLEDILGLIVWIILSLIPFWNIMMLVEEYKDMNKKH